MASNMAARRAAKANRRKAVLAEKRRAEAQSESLAARVLAATAAPIRECLLTEGWQEAGMATLVLTRGVTASQVSLAMFLLDTQCLGVKDVAFRSLGGDDAAAFVEAASAGMALAPIDPSQARKLLRDLAAWAAANGFPQHRDFAAIEPLFGPVRADDSPTEFQFGQEGKPFYIPGPYDTPAQIRQRLAQVGRARGGSGELDLLPAEATIIDDDDVTDETRADLVHADS